jgi:DHA3 family macrolide efflux protein-like MFS transporter
MNKTELNDKTPPAPPTSGESRPPDPTRKGKKGSGDPRKSKSVDDARWKRNVALFLGGQGISLFGSMLVQYAIGWHITLRTGSGSMMTVFILTGILPMFFISPFAGVWADRFNRKYLIVIADGVIALVTLIIALCFAAGYDGIWLLLICAAIRALGQGVQAPAVGAFLPQITPAVHLTKVNGINGSIQSLTMLGAPLLSGALLSFAAIDRVFFIDVATAAVGITVLLVFVRAPAALAAKTETGEGAAKGINYFHDLREGVRYIRRHGFIMRLIVFSTVFFIAVSPTAFLTPLQVARQFGADIWRLTAVEIAFSAGMMAGGLLIGLWGGFKNRVYSMALACALFGIEAIALGLLGHFYLYLAVMAVMGVTMPLYNTPSTVMLQTLIEPEYMGRVFSVFSMISSLMMPAGMLLWGPLSDRVSINSLLVITGAAMCLLAIPFVASRTLRLAGTASPS